MSDSKITKNIYILPNNPEELLEKIINSYPEEDFQSLRKIIGIGKVKYQEEMGTTPVTAAVVNTKPYTLLFGKSFLENNMHTMEDCVYVLSHELTHLVLDHFSKDILNEFEEKQLAFKAIHIIVDCQVNATCFNSLKKKEYFEFIQRFYPQNEMPYCFFRFDGNPLYDVTYEPELDENNNPILENGKEKLKKKLLPLDQNIIDKLKKIHKKLFSIDGITNKELIDGLMPWFKDQQDQLDEVINKLLGNHKDVFKNKTGEDGDKELEELVEGMAKDLKKSIDKDKTEETVSNGSDTLETPREQQIQTCLDKIEYSKNIKRQLKNREVVNPSSRIYKAIDLYFPKRSSRSVIPNFYDRRTSILYSQEKLPVFHNRPTFGSKICVPCYLDVSGSQDHVIPYMLPVVSRLKKNIGNFVYCFSTYVSETKFNQLELGKIKSSGGTDFNVVAEHILKNKFKNAIILTDGEACLNDDLIKKLLHKNVNITVGWTVDNPSIFSLSKVAKKTFYVFKD